MKEELISFETAKLAKEKGFNEPTYSNWNTSGGFETTVNLIYWNTRNPVKFPIKYSVSTQSLLQKWLREVHNLHIYIDTTPVFDQSQGSKYKALVKIPFQPFKWTTGKYYLGNTYEEALEKGLQEALKLI